MAASADMKMVHVRVEINNMLSEDCSNNLSNMAGL